MAPGAIPFRLIEPHRSQRTLVADINLVIDNLRNDGYDVTVYMPDGKCYCPGNPVYCQLSCDLPLVWAKIPTKGKLILKNLGDL